MATVNHQDRPLDLICLGRVAVDFYGQQIGSRLEEMTTFSKYLGGSSGNVAYGTAVQGLRSSMLARVGDEHMGRFLREELQSVGVDTSHLITDKERLTALVILGIKDKETFPLIFYRDNCADMAITKDDFSEAYIASSRCLAITGTHLSNPKTREAVLTALEYAGRNEVKRALDIDYRPVLWGLTSLGDGETRYIDSAEVTKSLQEVLHHFDLIVGTEEEFHIAGGSTDTLTALKNVRKVSNAVLVCKRGALGCSVFEGELPNDLDGGLNVYGVRVEVLNVLGAGDAFMSGLLRGYLNNEGWEQACHYANACGALVVSRHGCSPAMPTKRELDDYLTRAESVPRPDLDERLNHLHRVTTRKKQWENLCIFAFDHRKQLVDMANKVGADLARIPKLKQLLLKA
ncbi:TPA: 5-dehydro-2-deoxygluconokinase, partial [Mannheimia haemolytica]|nr:5-dehydro-2-deoxygluconokinase [Mannheimia haemolytica]